MAKGIGDVIANVTDALGIPKCKNCEERQEKLNKLFPFKNHLQFTDSEKKFMAGFLEWYNGLPIPIDKVNQIIEAEQIWLRIFQVKTGACKSCGSHYQTAFIKDLIKLYEKDNIITITSDDTNVKPMFRK
jgi:hypothetical protein